MEGCDIFDTAQMMHFKTIRSKTQVLKNTLVAFVAVGPYPVPEYSSLPIKAPDTALWQIRTDP